MLPIVPIFQIQSTEPQLSELNYIREQICDFGNGFLISSDGLIVSSEHVLVKEGSSFPYALIKGILHRINILPSKKISEQSLNIDISIGKVNVNNISYYDPSLFQKVEESSTVTLKGYSRIINNESKIKFDFYNPENYFFEFNTCCIDKTYGLYLHGSNNLTVLRNFFTIAPIQVNLRGMSGCPIFNANNFLVGIFKGNAEGINRNEIKLRGIHIEMIKELIN